LLGYVGNPKLSSAVAREGGGDFKLSSAGELRELFQFEGEGRMKGEGNDDGTKKRRKSRPNT
jgi:hypothetical protein